MSTEIQIQTSHRTPNLIETNFISENQPKSDTEKDKKLKEKDVIIAKQAKEIDDLRRKLAEANSIANEYKKDSIIDSLTKLYNRRYLDDYVTRFDLSRDKKPVSVLFCDVDGLGEINKILGDKAGDMLLVSTANFLTNSVRKGDIVIRKGGDEFVVIFEKYSNFEVLNNRLTERLKSKLTECLKSKQEPKMSFSFGIVEYDSNQDKSLLDTVERANYEMRQIYPNKKILKK